MRNHPTTRILAALELLQTHGRLNGSELATRLSVDRRTVRRYIALLEELGIPITTGRGPLGGYELVAGYKLPPMMFTAEEALALSLGLTAVRGLGLAGGGGANPAIAGAQAKLERVLPANLKARVRSISESVAFARLQPSDQPGDGASLAALSSAAHARRGVRLRYRAPPPANETERDFDPYGLAFTAGRWYTSGYCHLRKGLRSFRLDRVVSIAAQARSFERPAGFDVVAHLATSIATLPRKFSIEVVLQTDLASARRELFQAIGILEPLDGATAPAQVLLRSQAGDLHWFARELARLPWPFEVRRPAALIDAVHAHARNLLAGRRPRAAGKMKVSMAGAKPKFQSVDEYLAAQPEPARAVLARVRGAIRKALPAAEESISYQLPTYKLPGGQAIYFAGWKRHWSLYPASAALLAAFKGELAPYEIEKATIRFPLTRPAPVKLIGRLAQFRAAERSAKKQPVR